MVEMAQCSLILTSPPIRGQYLGSLISIWELLNYYHRYLMLFLQFHHSFLDSDPLFTFFPLKDIFLFLDLSWEALTGNGLAFCSDSGLSPLPRAATSLD